MSQPTKDQLNEKLAVGKRAGKSNFWNSTRFMKLPWSDEHEERMRWFRQARLGAIITYGLYSVLGRNEWVRNIERIPRDEYVRLADRFQPKPGCCEEWVRLAAESGMKYAVLTTKHHEGFCLWDTAQTPFNAVRLGPKRDLIREYVDACRRYGLKVGLYYSLMDWHHEDGFRCKTDEAARKCFLEFTNGCIDELCSNYGAIDIMWFDVPSPLSPEQWGAEEMIDRIRRMQPGIVVNDRTALPGDFATPEEGVVVAEPGRDWEAAMTFNRAWGYVAEADQDYRSCREILALIRQVTAHGGNLLLNIGPKADGSVPEPARERLNTVGPWLSIYGEAVYGDMERLETYQLPRVWTGDWTARSNTVYLWMKWWQGSEFTLGGYETKPRKMVLLATGEEVDFVQDGPRIHVRGLPESCPEPDTGVTVFRLEFAERPAGTRGMTIDW
jgi:alpha-L-fucosidase